MANIVIEALKREGLGKSAAKKLRAEGLIPAEFYSHEENLHCAVPKKEFELMLSKGHGLLDLKIKGTRKKHICVVKDVQYDPVRGDVLHVDFQGVTMGEKMKINVPLVLTGTAAGVKLGGILEHLVRELEIECLPKHLPEKLEIDVTDLQIGQAIHVKDLSFENIEILDDPEETVVLIEHPKVGGEETAVAAEEEEITEPEVITAKKED
ncbi:MAG: 50S ribosomal protein L25/general stress protein Ctc [Calditrichia bacterium]